MCLHVHNHRCSFYLLNISTVRYVYKTFCLCAHAQGRESGTLNRYAMPQLNLTHKHLLNCRPHQLAINCLSKYAVAIVSPRASLLVAFKYRSILISITSTAWFESMLDRCSVLCVWLQTFVHHWHCWRANLLWRRYSRHWPKRSRGHWRAHQVIWAQGRLGHEVGQCKCSRFDVTVLCVCACIASIY